MDLSKLKNKLTLIFGRYKFVILILCIGLVLILLPTAGNRKAASSIASNEYTEFTVSVQDLAKLLSQMNGVGRVKVMLSIEHSGKTDYQLDQETGDRTTTVTITDAQRNETGLITKTCAPVYRGAIVICDGADDPIVQLSVINAVSNITGLRSHQITVLKMK